MKIPPCFGSYKGAWDGNTTVYFCAFSVMYVQNSLDEPKRVFLDPNKFSSDGTVALDSYEFSEDGKYLTYATSESGSDWTVVHFMDVATRKHLQDVLYDTQSPRSVWSPGGKGIFYTVINHVSLLLQVFKVNYSSVDKSG